MFWGKPHDGVLPPVEPTSNAAQEFSVSARNGRDQSGSLATAQSRRSGTTFWDMAGLRAAMNLRLNPFSLRP